MHCIPQNRTGQLSIARAVSASGGRLAAMAMLAGNLMAGPAWASGPLAELPAPGGYISVIRVIIILVAMVPWLLFCQWLDKDISRLRKMNREMWNGIVLGGGVAGMIIWLFLPWQSPGLFAAGFEFNAAGTEVTVKRLFDISLAQREERSRGSCIRT